jgi:hypothetical protein
VLAFSVTVEIEASQYQELTRFLRSGMKGHASGTDGNFEALETT